MRIGIIGAGIIGGSLAKALNHDVFIYDKVSIDTTGFKNITQVSSIKELKKVADVFILATHLDSYEEILQHFKKDQRVILNTGSVQLMGEELAEKYKLGNFWMFHPIAGSEKSGWENSRADLFKNKTIAIDSLPPDIVKVVCRDLQIGYVEYFKSGEQHDDIMVRTSHYIQHEMFYNEDILQIYKKYLELKASLSDSPLLPICEEFFRLRNSSKEMWEPIFKYAKPSIERMLSCNRNRNSYFEEFLTISEIELSSKEEEEFLKAIQDVVKSILDKISGRLYPCCIGTGFSSFIQVLNYKIKR